MESIMHELMNRFRTAPRCEQQAKETDCYWEMLKPVLSSEQRKWLLRLNAIRR